MWFIDEDEYDVYEYDDDDDDDDDDGLQILASNAFNNDSDFAFNLQLQEAMDASLSLQQPSPSPSSSTSSAPGPWETSGSCSVSLYEFQFKRLIPERLEHEKLTKEAGKNKEYLPEEEDMDNHGRKYGIGILNNLGSETFRVYCKGLIEKAPALQNFKSHNKGMNEKHSVGGIGVVICDSNGNPVFHTSKPLHVGSICRQGLEVKALIEGLNVALSFGIKRVIFHCNYHPIFQYATGKWKPRQRTVESLVNQLTELCRNFTYCVPALVSSHKTRLALSLAISLASKAIKLQKTTPAETSGVMIAYENCVVCLEDININQIFSVENCKHRYCFSCTRKHIAAKLLDGVLPKCPHEGCKSEMNFDSCFKFLTSNLAELFTKLINEASIPVIDKLYCPYPKCSALMSKTEVLFSKAKTTQETPGIRKCVKCNGLFCILCHVPWHAKMTCLEYKTRYPHPCGSDGQLTCLAETKSWRQCVKCKHMIELAEGCYHMTCRCGYEFCYTCGAEYKDKKATCTCPSWDEEYIISGTDEEEWFEDEEEE